MSDFNRATELTPDVLDEIRDAFTYHPWSDDQKHRGEAVRSALMAAVNIIVHFVPPGPDRSAAIRKIREARMDCNSAITHGGKY